MSNSNYLDTLNPSQRAAVEYCDGPQLVIAGAGSGKTRVLTCKIAYLLQHNYTPDSIIALTFTKKAATEMQQRIDQLVGGKSAHRLWMGTFHSIFCRILRREAQRIGFKSDFTIYDQKDSQSLLSEIIDDLLNQKYHGDKDTIEKAKKLYRPNSVHDIISNAKNNLITPKMYLKNRLLVEHDTIAKRPWIGEIYQRYWNRCYQAGAMDFDDLLLYTNILFRDNEETLAFYQDRFKYVLVDEYQDTNRAQHLIVEKLVQKNQKLTVVGDDAQSIYSFRGANIHNILDLREQIPGTRLFKLEQNYRSSQNIVEAANSLIAKNTEQIKKTIYSEKERGSRLRLIDCSSDLVESYMITKKIEELHENENYKYRDCAILYRTNAQSRSLEDALRQKGIDYRIFGGLSFYQRAEIKDVISMLRLVVNPADEAAFKRVIKACPFGIGSTTLEKMTKAVSFAVEQDTSLTLFEIAESPDSYISVNNGTKSKLNLFFQTIIDCQRFSQVNDVYDTVCELLRKFHYNEILDGDTSFEGRNKKENVQELVDSIHEAAIEHKEAGEGELNVTEYLSTISLDEPDPAKDDPNRDYVALMTIHQAKGLEFKNVFIVGIEENLLPSDMSSDSPSGIEEERRLFYVAITRAEENCFLSYATYRFRNGKSEPSRPSRFLKDIDPRFIQRVNNTTPVADYSRNGGGSFFGATSSTPVFETRRTFSPTPRPATTSYPTEEAAHPRTPMDLHNPRKVAMRQTALDTPASLTYGGKEIVKGTRIVHDRFGQGTVKELSGRDGDARIVVSFDTMGDKTLLLKFVKLTVID